MMYNDAWFDEPIDRRGTACEKWDGLMGREGRELNPMWVADMDFRCPKEVTDALAARAAHPVYGTRDAGFYGAPSWPEAERGEPNHDALRGNGAEGGRAGLYRAG